MVIEYLVPWINRTRRECDGLDGRYRSRSRWKRYWCSREYVGIVLLQRFSDSSRQLSPYGHSLHDIVAHQKQEEEDAAPLQTKGRSRYSLISECWC